MISKSTFFEKYNIDQDKFDAANLDWEELTKIYEDFQFRRDELHSTAKGIVDRLLLIKEVHSVRYRIKDSEHLVEKIIRKTIGDKRRKYTLLNYLSKIDDLIGIRALHLFKDQSRMIDDFIINNWKTKETPKVYKREGDSENSYKYFEEKGYKIENHKYAYRSVHFVVETRPTKTTHYVEIQVRTIFEEGWSEIDHSIRYPYDLENPILKQYLIMFNRLAGNADEMGTYIKFLQNHLQSIETAHKFELQKRDEKISELKEKIESLKIKSKDKEDLQIKLQEIEEFDWSKYLKLPNPGTSYLDASSFLTASENELNPVTGNPLFPSDRAVFNDNSLRFLETFSKPYCAMCSKFMDSNDRKECAICGNIYGIVHS